MSKVVIPGARIGHWTIEERLGAGSFGTAWRVVDDSGRVAALKVLQAPPGDELRALARICHPAVPAVLGADGAPLPYVVMELARGAPLSKMLRAGRAPEDRAAAVAAILADGLAAVHHAGLTHGDVKPDNVIVGSIQEGRVWLVDFGLAGAGAGGTLQYAAPECLSSAAATSASDVYSLGLMLWEMLHGKPPWSNLDLSQSLLKRRQESPAPERGADWMKELLQRMLAPDPAQRPTAAQIADTLSAHGARLPQPGAELLRRRARTVHISRPDLEARLELWYERGGHLTLTGPSGIGRTHTLEQVITELRARGLPWVRLVGSAHPWSGIEQALVEPRLPGTPVALPSDADPNNRAETAAALLEERAASRLAVIVDDVDCLDPGTAQTLMALIRRGRASVCVSRESAMDAPDVTPLTPLSAADIGKLVSGILGGDANLEPLIEKVQAFSGGVPGPAVDLLVAATASGALVRRAHRWLVDDQALDELAASADFLEELSVDLSESESRVGGLLALHGMPTPQSDIAELTGLTGEVLGVALRGLVDRGLVRVEADVATCTSRAASTTLTRMCPDPVAVHQLLIQHLLDQPEPPMTRLGWHAAGANDTALIKLRGAEMINSARTSDASEGVRLADALWERAPIRELAHPRLEAMLKASQPERGREFALSLLGDRDIERDDIPVLLALADMTSRAEDDAQAMSHVVRAYRALQGERPPIELLHIEASVHFQAKRYKDAIEVARTVARQAPPEDEASLDIWLRLLGIWAQSLHSSGQLKEAIEALEELPEELGQGRPARALLEAALGRLLWHDGRIREAAAAMMKAAGADAGLPAMERARMLNNCAIATYHSGDRLGALARWEDALLLFERLGSFVEQVRVSVNLCAGYREAGRWERARQAGQWAVDAATEKGIWELVAMSSGNMGDLAMSLSRYDDAEAWFKRAHELSRQHALTSELVELARRRAELAIRREDNRALMEARAAVKAAEKADDRLQTCLGHALVAVALARRGQNDKIDAELELAMTPLREVGASGELAWVRLWAGEAYLSVGRVRDALAECDRVTVYAEEMGHVPMRAQADQLMSRCRELVSPDTYDRRLERLLELAVAVGRERDLDTLLGTIADAALELLQGDRSFLILVDDDGVPVVAASRSCDGEEAGEPSMSVVSRCISGKREIIAADIGERGDLRAAESVLALDLRSALCAPLIEGDATLGALYVDSRLTRDNDLSESARFMRALAAHAAVAVVNARHLRDVARRAEAAAEVAHDLKGPSAAVMTIARDLQGTPYDPAHARESLNAIVELSRRSIAMVRNFLDQRPSKMRDRVNLSRVTSSLLEVMSFEIESKSLNIDWTPCEDAIVLGNADELGRVLMNLLTNAMKYSPPEGVIHIALTQGMDALTWSIRDEGPGVPEEQLTEIFRRGVQVQGALPGYGLGLYIVQRVVHEMGGEVSVQNHPRGGAEFTLCLPAAERMEAAA